MGIWPLIAPLLAAGTVILTVVFADQTLATVLEATRIRTAIGQANLVHREPALLLSDPADRGRLAVAAFRLPDHRAVAVPVDVHHVAPAVPGVAGVRPGG